MALNVLLPILNAAIFYSLALLAVVRWPRIPERQRDLELAAAVGYAAAGTAALAFVLVQLV